GDRAGQAGASWVGSPGFFLPQRGKNAEDSGAPTYKPPGELRLPRAAIEFFPVLLPSTGFICLTPLLLSPGIVIRDAGGDALWLPLFPLLYAGCGLSATAVVILLKWVLIGKFRPVEKPLWSNFVWRNELITALHENLSDPFLVDKLRGTPFIA